MNPNDQTTEQAMEAVVEQGRQFQPVPDVVRIRLLARARAHVQATSGTVLVPSPVLLGSPWRGRRLAFAAAALLAFSTAGAAAALYVRGSRAPQAIPAPQPAPMIHAPSLAVVAAPIPAPAPATAPERTRRPLSPQESYAAELSLLQRAHAQYNARAFRGALALLTEHARQFPGGRLAEEREALRVRSLEAAGREPEARRALAAFGKRFPRSALLPRLREGHAAESASAP